MFATYQELIAALPDNSSGLIDASDVRAIAEMLTPAWYLAVEQDAVMDLAQGVETILLFGPSKASQGDWGIDEMSYMSPVSRLVDIRVLLHTSAAAGVTWRLYNDGDVICEVVQADEVYVRMSAVVVAVAGDTFGIKAIQTTTANKMIDVHQLQVEALGYLLKPEEGGTL